MAIQPTLRLLSVTFIYDTFSDTPPLGCVEHQFDLSGKTPHPNTFRAYTGTDYTKQSGFASVEAQGEYLTMTMAGIAVQDASLQSRTEAAHAKVAEMKQHHEFGSLASRHFEEAVDRLMEGTAPDLVFDWLSRENDHVERAENEEIQAEMMEDLARCDW